MPWFSVHKACQTFLSALAFNRCTQCFNVSLVFTAIGVALFTIFVVVWQSLNCLINQPSGCTELANAFVITIALKGLICALLVAVYSVMLGRFLELRKKEAFGIFVVIFCSIVFSFALLLRFILIVVSLIQPGSVRIWLSDISRNVSC